jgi:dsDNA-specific endonuclease/ATPase MutS2
VSGVTMAMKLTDLAMLPSSSFTSSKPKKRTQGSKLSRSVEKALKTEVNNKPVSKTLADSSKSEESVVFRMDSNTVDCLGCNFEEAKDRVKIKISQAMMNGRSVLYVLHGHGTGGVLKTKVRNWLRSEKQLVKRWNPAEQSDGGDAFTRLELK